ncbi:MAG: hypothetical protein AAF628_19560 [Planctomycetota bacterium]
MKQEQDRDLLRRCEMRQCGLHDARAGCRAAAGVAPPEVLVVLQPEGGLGQARCVLLDILGREVAGPKVRWRTAGDVLGRLFLLLRRIASRAQRTHVSLGYVLAALARERVDDRRRHDGRPRCGSCVAYGWVSRRCLARGTVDRDELAPTAEPGRLEPACHQYVSVRAATPAPEAVAAGAAEERRAERVLAALEQLAATQPDAARLLVGHYFERRSVRRLAAETNVDRRELAQRLRRAEVALGELLEGLA